MGWFDGFPFKSREQMQREQRDFERRVLPLGDESRPVILSVLRAVTGPRMDDNARLWAYFAAKDAYTSYEEDEALAAAKALAALKGAPGMNRDDQLAVLALIKLDCGVTDLASYPGRDVVLTLADELSKSL